MKNSEKEKRQRKRESRRRSKSSNAEQRERNGGEFHFILAYIEITVNYWKMLLLIFTNKLIFF